MAILTSAPGLSGPCARGQRSPGSFCPKTWKEEAAVSLESLAGRIMGKYHFFQEDRKSLPFGRMSSAVSGLFVNQSQLKAKQKKKIKEKDASRRK